MARTGASAPRTWPLAVATGLPLTAVGAPNVALPSIAADLGAGFGAQQWVVAIYALLLAALQFASGPIADRLGRRRTTLLGLALFAIGSVGAAAAPSVAVLVVARGVQGAGGALTITGALALMAASTAGADRLRAVAVRSAVIAVSFAIGPLLGGLLVDGPGWRWIFLTDALVAIPLIARLARADTLPEPQAVLAAQADWLGLVVLTGGLLAGVAATIRGNDLGWGSPAILALFGVAVAATAAFVARDRRSPAPLLPARLVRDPAFQVTTLGLAGLYFALFGGMVYLTRYLQVVKGESATDTGLLLVPFAASSLLAVLLVTRRTGSRNDRTVVVPAFLAGALGLATLHSLTPDTSLWALMPALVLVGIASGVINPLSTAGHLATFSPRDGGIAAGINSSARQLGTALGTAVLGAVVQHGDATSPAAVASRISTALLVGAAVLAALALLAAVRLRPA
ncbi:MAG TPA: MFS transporter [Baekduia sp.]|nr:MFS transporter [Baekduia sp.]